MTTLYVSDCGNKLRILLKQLYRAKLLLAQQIWIKIFQKLEFKFSAHLFLFLSQLLLFSAQLFVKM